MRNTGMDYGGVGINMNQKLFNIHACLYVSNTLAANQIR